MVLGYHLVWTAYGWWLPNDPRGSMSHCIESDVIAQLGELHYGRKKVQPASREIRRFYERAKDVLKYPLLRFSKAEMQAIAEAFAEVIKRERYTCYACAIMPDHIHGLVRKHRDLAEDMIEKLQDQSRFRVLDVGERDAKHPVWGGPGWKVYLDCPEDFWRTVRYIEQNPLEAHLPAQRWSFVTPYDGWPVRKGAPDSATHCETASGQVGGPQVSDISS
jgi:REP element-mobilizing transposase RayT